MRDVSCLQGVKDLQEIKKYAIDSLTPQEKIFIKKVERKIKDYINEKIDEFLTLEEIVKLSTLWQKYSHLKPFVFCFNPKEKISKVFQNRTAFIIWTVWGSFHLLGQEDLQKASLAAAQVLSNFKAPCPSSVKKKAIEEFNRVMVNTGYLCINDLNNSFWENRIFPYLERKWEFKWEIR